MRMKKRFVLLASLMIACGAPMALTSNQNLSGFTAIAQSNSKVTGTVTDLNGEPLIGATVVVKGTKMVLPPMWKASSLSRLHKAAH